MKIGLIGCGKQAPKHIAGLEKVDDTEIVVCDIDADRARSTGEKFGLLWTSNVAELLSDPMIVAINIATPTPTHAELARRALESGKHFFCEKPLCENLDDARRITQLASDENLIGMVGYVYRYAPVFEFGHELTTASGTDNKIDLGNAISAWFRIGGRGGHEIWKHRLDSGGGASSEMLVHMLDLAIWYFGPVRSAEVLAKKLLRPRRQIRGENILVDAEDFILARLTMANGIDVFTQADLVTPSFCQFAEIQFEHGSFMGSIQADMPSYLFCSNETGAYQAGKTMLDVGSVNSFDCQMAAFCECVRERSMPARNSLKDSLLVMEALEMLQQDKVD